MNLGAFADLDQARTWAASFVHWYNHAHGPVTLNPATLTCAEAAGIAAPSELLKASKSRCGEFNWHFSTACQGCASKS